MEAVGFLWIWCGGDGAVDVFAVSRFVVVVAPGWVCDYGNTGRARNDIYDLLGVVVQAVDSAYWWDCVVSKRATVILGYFGGFYYGRGVVGDCGYDLVSGEWTFGASLVNHGKSRKKEVEAGHRTPPTKDHPVKAKAI